MKKIVAVFIFGFAAQSLAVVSSAQKTQQAVKEAEEKNTQADTNINEAKKLLDTGSVDQAKEAVKKAADSTAAVKQNIQALAATTKEATNKMEDIAATTSQSKKSTQEVKNDVKKVQDSAKEIHKAIGQAATTVKNVQQAHAAGNVQQVKEHTDKAVGLLQELEAKIKELWDNIGHVYEKAKNADEAVKTQTVLVSPGKDVKDYGSRVRTTMRPEAVDEEWD